MILALSILAFIGALWLRATIYHRWEMKHIHDAAYYGTLARGIDAFGFDEAGRQQLREIAEQARRK